MIIHLQATGLGGQILHYELEFQKGGFCVINTVKTSALAPASTAPAMMNRTCLRVVVRARRNQSASFAHLCRSPRTEEYGISEPSRQQTAHADRG